MSRTTELDAQIAAAHATTGELRQQHSTLSLKVSEQPANAELHAQLDALDADIAAAGKTKARLDAARSEALRLDQIDLRKSTIADVQASQGTALEHADDEIACCGRVDKLIWQLGGELANLEEIQRKKGTAVHGVAVHGALTIDQFAGIMDEARSPHLADAFLARLAAVGVGVGGIDCRNSGFNNPVHPSAVTVEDTAKICKARLQSRLHLVATRAIKRLSGDQ